jgi:23S rRNA (adenine2503-C2)-methyltransferase
MDMKTVKPHITDLSLAQLKVTLEAWGEPSYRARQVTKWLYRKRAGSFQAMTDIGKQSRARLEENFSLEKPRIEACLESSRGDAVKFGLAPFASPSKGHVIECVLLRDRNRRTACVSSQLGCALGCTFCETAAIGFIRNLTLAEVTGQLITINDYLEKKIDKPLTNVVFMGMGEALCNFDVFKSTVEIITSDEGFVCAPRRITVSTAGVVPSIDALAAARLGVQLAISLNAFSNDVRDRLMPVNRRYPIERVLDAARRYAKSNPGPVTFEYVVIEGENDTPESVGALCALLHGIRCKLNLIPVNPARRLSGRGRPDMDHLRRFAQSLYDRGILATVRTSRGADICGACGQLSGGRGA